MACRASICGVGGVGIAMANECGMQCPVCGEAELREEGAHGRCDACGYRGACCW